MSRRITTTILATVVGTVVLLGTATFLVARVQVRQQTLQRIERQVAQIADLLPNVRAATATETGAQRRTNVARRVQRSLDLSGLVEISVDENCGISGDIPRPLRASDLDCTALRDGDVVGGTKRTLVYAAALRPNVGRAEGTKGFLLTSRIEPIFGPTFRWFALFSGIAVVLGAVLAWGLGRRLAAPVHAAVATTRAIAAGDLDARLPSQSGPPDDELAVLTSSINTMAEGLQRAKAQERSFLLSVSHDLRTPMTSIRGYAEAIADGATDDPVHAATVILGESKRLERLVGDLLDLARLDAQHFELHPVDADLGDLVGRAVAAFRAEATTAGVTLHYDAPKPGAVRASVDADRCTQMIANLVGNALGFASSTVWVRVQREGPDAVVEVVDDGPGIAASELGRVFERLYQADNQRDRRRTGSGLGLAIVEELAQRMGARVGVSSDEGDGARFWIRLPAATA